ncbi:ABC transporter ATP-binding protein [Halobellus clavatus]|jgi:ABC-type Fe3+/spermidine/putrescine transport system ATPase subunit|uniref:Molybdate/tungstate import ATP-binding protein WtpC n=1 Tax=Halobellus clavatus TaxID=660517 RepID=A0A1H3HIS8_9EURY|nr:ABC transporter ATP-binding protein [Halobellus clavatus]SDY15260.1 spermidine/putrescine transport system ATP-binding protein [Halobellus clavatus]
MNETSDLSTQSEQPEQTESRGTMLDVSGLTKIYPDGTLAVDGIDFTVDAGDFCVIIGPSGCGKSTTLHSLVGNLDVTSGTISLDGTDITDQPTHTRDIGLVFQDFQLFPHLTVAENIVYGLEQMGLDDQEKRRRTERLLEMMQLEELADRDPEELSAGQKQRVALARSLVLEPKLLLLDEPLGDMDYKLQKRMERELLRIHREFDTTFIYVTHDQTQAMRLADQIIVMNDGQVEQSGSVAEIYNSPNTAFVSAFVGDSNTFTGTLEKETTDSSVTINTELGSFTASPDNLHSPISEVIESEMSFLVRPQHLELSDEHENTLECAVQDVIWNPGSSTQVLLDVRRDDASKELRLKSWELSTVPEGDVRVSWKPEHTILLEQTSVVEGIDLEKDILGS